MPLYGFLWHDFSVYAENLSLIVNNLTRFGYDVTHVDERALLRVSVYYDRSCNCDGDDDDDDEQQSTTDHACVRKDPCALRTAPLAVVTSARLFSSRQEASRAPLPSFTCETAALKVRAAEDAWNTRDPARVTQAYTIDSTWRDRSEFVNGRDEIEAFLARKWEREYRLVKELFAFDGNRIAVCFAYEWLDGSKSQWFRAYGNENWEFDAYGYMAKRFASINDVAISEHERKFHWQQGCRPDDHPSLSDLDL